MTWQVAVNLLVFVLLLVGLYEMQRRGMSFGARVFTGLVLGLVFGWVLLWLYGAGAVINASIDWFNLVGNGYVRLLQMLIMPLVFVSIVTAFTKMELRDNVAKVGGLILVVLLGTTAIAALVGIGATALFGLDASQITAGERELARMAGLETTYATTLEGRTLPQQLLELLPTNVFQDFTGARRTSTIAVVIFSAFVGMAYLSLMRRDANAAGTFRRAMEALHGIVMGIVRIVIRLTPYGVMAIMARVAATSDYDSIVQLGKFVVASYVALAVMFGVHLLLLALAGLNPVTYVRKAAPVLAFAFTSRSSAATLPLNVETQERELGVPVGTANLAGSLGLSIGQNGCAGIYPAMLAMMAAPMAGIDPFTPGYILTVVAVVTFSSFGVASVGGGATFAALLVLSLLNLPVGLAGLLISVEPLIDMGRTALNVSDSMLAGVLTSRIQANLNVNTYTAAPRQASA
ncbi:MAG: sodium:dicarboxylate symporter [Firmicutes bacterium ZCTH02-B6]|nr:MAG: sodium:dicarboxylate symporter [Firmicutes bacterium ZCTH02-B6]